MKADAGIVFFKMGVVASCVLMAVFVLAR